MRSDLLLIIPVYNEGENIARVINELQSARINADYIIINDGSYDATEQICNDNGYSVINIPINVGLSHAFHIGMKYALKNNYKMAMQYDGDGQHDPKYIDNLVQKMLATHAGIVIGSRYLTQKSAWSLRRFGNILLNKLIFLVTNKVITDATSGMRLYDYNMIKFFCHDKTVTPEPDMLVYMINNGIHIEEVQVSIRNRIAGTSYLNVANSMKYMFNMCISIIFSKIFKKRINIP